MVWDAVVIGAGPAGLAAASELERGGLRTVVLERANAVGASWRTHYDRLRLNTVRWLSHLPRYRLPRRLGPWVARDGFVAYLEEYAATHRLELQLETEVARVDRGVGAWSLETSRGELGARVVVVATGTCNTPCVPDWPGRETYLGELIHSSQYRNPAAFRGRDVLVVGSGNSGAEIAADLAENGAARTRLAIRTPPQIVPRTILGIPTIVVAVLTRRLPPQVGDSVMRILQRVAIGDLSGYGIARPLLSISRQFSRSDVVPISDPGAFVAGVKKHRIEVVAPVVAFDVDSVLLGDGSRIAPDVVIAATGFELGLEPLVGHLGVLRDGRPAFHGGRSHPAAPALYFIGFANPLSGNLREIRLEARRIARAANASMKRRRSWAILRPRRRFAGQAGAEPSRAPAAP
jgi:putative flavoprotein involved in K+ transport